MICIDWMHLLLHVRFAHTITFVAVVAELRAFRTD